MLFCAWIVAGTAASGQVIENRFTHYTSKDGLADGQIISITQDKDGFLWLGSRGGLSRFDGHDFKVFRYDPTDTNSLRENGVTDFMVDSANGIWMLTSHWLHLYHPEDQRFEHFNISSFSDDIVGHFCCRESGCLIFAGNKSLYQFDIAQKRFSYFKIADGKKAPYEDYKKDDDGMVWFARENNLLRYDPSTRELKVFDSAGGAIFFCQGRYVVTLNYGYGVHLIDKKTFEVTQCLPIQDPSLLYDNAILCYYKLDDTDIVIGTLRGIATFSVVQREFTFIKPDPLNPSSLMDHDDQITSLYRDREGILWFGGRHLEKYDFPDYDITMVTRIGKDRREKPFRSAFTVYRCSNGNFLLGDYNSALVYEPATDELKQIRDPGFLDHVADNFTEDANGTTWCNVVDASHFFPKICAFKLAGGKATNLRQFSVPIERGIRDMKISRNGMIYKTSRDGLVQFDTTTKAFTIMGSRRDRKLQLTSPFVSTICPARDGTLWVGTDNGVNKISLDGTIKQFKENTRRDLPLPDWYVSDMAEDTSGVIWVAIDDHGIGRIDPANDSISFLTVKEGLPTNLFDRLCADSSGNLWALSGMGVLRINTRTLQHHLYTEAEGFPSADDVKDIHFSKFNKRLYLLTDYSIFEIDPQSKDHSPKLPRTVVTEFSVFDKDRPVTASNVVNLKYNENFINIRFAAMQFHSNGQIKYAYKMEGVDQDWVYCNYRRNASYTNLPPGNYVFKVKAQNPAGVWNDVPTELNIFIKAPFWQTWWFSALEALLVVTIVFWIARFYTSRKLARQKIEFEKQQAVTLERTRIAADMHDELGAGLTSIRFLSEIANEKIQNSETARTEVAKIERSAAQLSENLREIIWTMNTRFDKLDDFIIYVRTYSVAFFDDTHVQLHFESPPVVHDIKIAGEVRRNIFLCIKEAFNNIVKHSGATDASINFDVTDNIMQITIKDNGKGIDAARLNKFGNGLTSMRERLRKCGGEMSIEVNGGTTLVFKARIS